jgi:D-lactate dehydrogenase
LNEDVVVPVTAIPVLIERLKSLSAEYGIPIVSFGHAGNGNLHVNLLYDTQDETQARNAGPCLRRVFESVVQLRGTLSGEHGVGREKRDYVDLEVEPATLAMMRRIKAQFDPKGLLNPGKIFPAA